MQMPSIAARQRGEITPRRPWSSRPPFAAAILTAVYCLSFIDRQILALCIGPISEAISANDAQMGVLGGFAFAVFYSLAAIPFGVLVDRYSRWPVAAGGLLLWSAATCFSGLATSYWQLFIGRAGVGIGEAAIVPAAASLMASYYKRTDLPRVMAVFMAAPLVGMAIANIGGGMTLGLLAGKPPLIVAGLPPLDPWRALFLLAGLPGIVAAFLLWRLQEPPRARDPEVHVDQPSGNMAGAVNNDPIGIVAFIKGNCRLISLHMLGFIAAATMYYALLYWVVEFLVRSFGVSRSVAGGSFGTIMLVSGLLGCALPGPVVARLLRRGMSDATNRVGVISAIIALPLAVAVSIAPNYISALAFLAILIFVMSLPLSFGISTMQIVSPPHLQGRMVAFYLTFANLFAFSIGPLSIGLVNDALHGGVDLGRSLAEVSAVCYGLSALFLWYSLKPLREKVRAITKSEEFILSPAETD